MVDPIWFKGFIFFSLYGSFHIVAGVSLMVKDKNSNAFVQVP